MRNLDVFIYFLPLLTAISRKHNCILGRRKSDGWNIVFENMDSNIFTPSVNQCKDNIRTVVYYPSMNIWLPLVISEN